MNKKFKYFKALFVGCVGLLGLTMASCDNEDLSNPILESEPTNLETSEILRTPAEAVEIASTAWHRFLTGGCEPNSRSNTRTVDFNSSVTVLGGKNKSRGESADTLMYVVNYADNKGFAIISAVKGTPEVIGVTELGNFNSNEVQSNPGLALYLENAKEMLAAELKSQSDILTDSNKTVVIKPLEPYIREKTVVDTIWIKKTPRRINLLWTQSSPYNSECPYQFNLNEGWGQRTVTGCGPLAIAMAAAAIKYPTGMTLTYPDRTEKYITLDWNNITAMSNHSDADTCPTDGYPTHKRIAQLIRQIGQLGGISDLRYGIDATGMTESEMVQAIKGLNCRNNKFKDVEKYSISDYLWPTTALVLIGVNPTTNIGHAWMCDSSLRYKLKSTHYVRQDDFSEWKALYVDYSGEICENYYHWGWGRIGGDGYYMDLQWPLVNRYNNEINYSNNFKFIIVEQ